jgi:hypothetical protein
MHTPTNTTPRAARGALIVRASTVAVGLAASVSLQFAGHDDKATVTRGTENPSILCAADANGSFAVL